jgi:hypothetical protein
MDGASSLRGAQGRKRHVPFPLCFLDRISCVSFDVSPSRVSLSFPSHSRMRSLRSPSVHTQPCTRPVRRSHSRQRDAATMSRRRHEHPYPMRDELPGWPGDCYDAHDGDPHTFGSARSACALLKKGGSWQSYAYNSADDGSISFNDQLLVCQRGKVMMQSATFNPTFIVAECELGVNSLHKLF